MGAQVRSREFTRADRRRFRDKVHASITALNRMLADGHFHDASVEPEPLIGMEIEFNLVAADMSPAMSSREVLESIDDSAVFQTELGQFNVEMNVEPSPLRGDAMVDLENTVRCSLDIADARIRTHDADLVMIGMLPTLQLEHLDRKWLTENPRYRLLNDQIFAARGEDIELDVVGQALLGGEQEALRADTDSVVPEAACTSLQLHLRVAPEAFAAHWNAAQAIAGVQVALAANSPFFAGRALWHETRVPIFEQATDTRTVELKNQGVRPRVWFGERWIDSALDLFEENSRYFPPLLPELDDADPLAVLEAGGVPELAELRMHNGTVYRWNRPVYDCVDGTPHLRIENRVLPAGPTVVDMLANSAFYYGVVRALVDADRPLWSQMSFDTARENLRLGARCGLDATLHWPETGRVDAADLILHTLLPLADQGLTALGVSAAARGRYLTVVEERCANRRTGAHWQRRRVADLEARGRDRPTALADMLRDYVENMREGNPVHTWV
ncbi:gamma-glutamyl:cysteine ligase YbdK (ATP-grasp superfamily) [Rhodococcus sp. 27YEA15]|uniref:glutamate-cysteine ligase family protein n=1 Tax=Rhodococcus sp. 27YEA15 TaxID=3156259 RepID=UPI003C7CDBB2